MASKLRSVSLGPIPASYWSKSVHRYYWQYKTDRLGAMRLTIHGFAHIPDDIIDTGPIWSTWSWLMERYAGSLLPAVKSKKKPNAVLARRVKNLAQLSIIKLLYNINEAAVPEISSAEIIYPECK